MDFEIIRPETKPQSAARWAVGENSGTLYFVPDVLTRDGIVVIGKGSLRGQEGKTQPVTVSELLPPGTTIKITT